MKNPLDIPKIVLPLSSLKDASGKSHYFNGGMKASSKLDFYKYFCIFGKDEDNTPHI